MAWLSFISVVFYATWRIDYVPLLLGSVLFNYACATGITQSANRPRLQRAIMIGGIVANLGVLVFFKYLFPSLSALVSLGLVRHSWSGFLLPLGISFFTFTQIGYLIDLRAGTAESHSFINYTLFVTFFPHLIAGPILHHKEIMPQFAADRKYKIDLKDFDIGLSWFLLGLAKKVLLADTIARFADSMFAQPYGVSFFPAWGGVLAYALQLYFDFSGYSDMAVGLARMFSIQFPLNFNSPYKASSIIDFWQRWHMTLTRYITLYVYNPVSMWIARRRIASGKSTSRKAFATPLGFASMLAFPTMFTMLLAGIWHGAGLQFVIYGVLHGCYITINHVWRVFGPKLTTPVKWIRGVSFVSGVALTFIAVMVAQVFFRADSTLSALSVIAGMAGLHGFGNSQVFSDFSLASGWQPLAKPLLILFMLSIVWAAPNTQKLMSYYPGVRIPGELKAAAYGVLGYVILYHTTTQSFIYFQF